MSAAVLALRPSSLAVTAEQALADAWATLRGEYDPMRVVWDEQATDADRRLLLTLARIPPDMARYKSGAAWCDLKPDERAKIALGLRKFGQWAERLK